MTAATTASPTSASPTPRQVWNRARGLLLGVLILVIAGITLAAVRSGDQHGRLDPRSADPFGSRAAAELLKDRGISVTVATTLDEATTAAGPDTTLLVVRPNLLTPSQQRRLHAATTASAGRTVLLAPGRPAVNELAPGVRAQPSHEVTGRAPACALAAARSAGTVDMGGIRYTADGLDTIACYPSGGLPSLLVLKAPRDGDTVLLGSPDFLHNERLGQQGNASLALQLLGSRPHLVWYLPSLADPSATEGNGQADSGNGNEAEDGGTGSEGGSSFLDLILSGWSWGIFQLALAAVLAALWRARRLGPLVTERLPVAIRASESAEGRARLYRKANARDRAAASLRHAARNRIAPFIGVSTHDAHSPTVLLPALSARLTTAGDDRNTLLFGPVPTDDAALVLLADQLDALEREVRTS
ncbi:DUF4350 domain-containing protein [Streptomyces sp. NBC_01433]|uniref:DUF4350 domain-containing protein n=1 Tax=Streptomyces sp. NBC_01433 TaxID=2903864 RepID=UPI00224E5E36|nr:DUF4350 domain-containing protein [Streptomyces sp. NBC_01433]MCX4676819.1 DUF4350 domain-containing protein [Streptomyces sp. NBC_01433]